MIELVRALTQSAVITPTSRGFIYPKALDILDLNIYSVSKRVLSLLNELDEEWP
jgi:hypothetical protein